MRASVLLAVLSLAAAPLSAAAPTRVASLNLCTDELLLMLADPRQIASVTHLSRQQEESSLWRLARRYPANDGSLLSIVSAKPDLILTMGGGARDRQVIAGRLKVPIVDVPYPQSLQDLQTSITIVGRALGRPGAAKSVNQRIDELRSSSTTSVRDTIWLGGGGRTVSAQGLAADWMRLAGMQQRSFTGDRVSLEQLLVRPPQILLRSDYRQSQYSSEQRWLSHPLARHVRAGKTLATDGRAWTCMGPTLVSEVERLRKELGR
jgi:iron complex transport system substrate-binding protein